MELALGLSIVRQGMMAGVTPPSGTVWADQSGNYWVDQSGNFWATI